MTKMVDAWKHLADADALGHVEELKRIGEGWFGQMEFGDALVRATGSGQGD